MIEENSKNVQNNDTMESIEERYRVFTGLILSLSRSIQKIKNAEMAKFELKGSQVQCIFTLYHAGKGMNLSDLAELCGEDKGAMSRTVKQLTEQGLVEQEKEEGRQYRTPVRLTPKGWEFASYVTKRIAEIARMGGVGLTEQGRDEMYRTLEQIDANLEKFCEESYSE